MLSDSPLLHHVALDEREQSQVETIGSSVKVNLKRFAAKLEPQADDFLITFDPVR